MVRLLILVCLMSSVAIAGILEGDPIRGGRLWDTWWTEIGIAPPSGRHALSNEQTATEDIQTFRCATCHGWDYKEVHTTSRTDAELFNLLKFVNLPNGHGYADHGLTDDDLRDLIAFLRRGTVDTNLYITPDGDFIGNPDAGANRFQQGTAGSMQCLVCHGPDGRWLNFGSHEDPTWLGTVAQQEPWRFLHMVRFGKPGTAMPSMSTLGGTPAQAADVGRYIQQNFPTSGIPQLTTPNTPKTFSSTTQVGRSQSGFIPLSLQASTIGPEARADDPPIIAHVELDDLNQDGMLDIVTCDVGAHAVLWDRQMPDGRFTRAIIASDIGAPVHAELADIDADGDIDVLVADMGVMLPSTDMSGQVILLENNGEDQFTPKSLVQGTHRVTDVQPGDLDGDGDLDLALAQFGYVHGAVQWMEQLEDGTFEMHHLMDRSGAIHSPIVDIDQDGDLDIVALFSQEWETVQAFINDGRGHFTPLVLHDVADADFSSSGIDVGDIDGDGDMDIAWANGDAFVSVGYRPLPTHGVQWLENLGQYQFQFHRLGHFDGAYGPTIADLDADGDADIVAVSEFADWNVPGTPSVRWWSQQEDGSFLSQDLAETPTHLVTCAVGDVDDDGWPDIVAGGMGLYAPFDRIAPITYFRTSPSAGEFNQTAIRAISPAVESALALASNAGQRGMILHANDLSELANAAYAEASEDEPTNPKWPYYRGLLATVIGDSQSATAYLQMAAELDANYAPIHIRLGELYAGQGNVFAAEQAWRRAQDHPMAAMGLAQIAADAGKWQQVIDLLEGRDIAPAAGLLTLARARVDGRTALPAPAMDMGLQPLDPWLDAVQNESLSPANLVVAAQIHFIAGRLDRATELLNRAIEVDPTNVDARVALATLLLMPNQRTDAGVTLALNHLNESITHDPDHLELRTQHAWAMYLAGQKEQAAAVWMQIIDEHPLHAPSLFQLAQWHGHADRPEEALRLYRRAVAVPRDTAFSSSFEGPIRSHWLLRYATAAKESGHDEEALEAALQAVHLTPEQHNARFQAGNLLVKLKRFDQAIRQLEAAVALNPGHARTLAASGYALAATGANDVAIKRMQAAVQAEPQFALGWYHLGTVYARTGQRDNAIGALTRAIQIRPGFVQARQALQRLQQSP